MRRLKTAEILLRREKVLGMGYRSFIYIPDDDENGWGPERATDFTDERRLYPILGHAHDIKITMGEVDRLKIYEFVKAAAPKEVYIKTLVERKKNHFHLHKPLFFKQGGNSCATKLESLDEDKYIRDLLSSGRPWEEIEKELLSIRCWFHSHDVDSPCWWSTEDERNCERFDNEDYFISVVVKIGYDNTFYYRCRLDFYEPKKEIRELLEKTGVYYPGRITLTNLTIEIIDDKPPDFNPEKIREDAEKTVHDKVHFLKEVDNETDQKGDTAFQKICQTGKHTLASDSSGEACGDNRRGGSWLARRLRAGISWLQRYYGL